MITETESRKAFEEWIAGVPRERNIQRFPESGNPWPGEYKDVLTQLAWKAWKAAVEWKESKP